MNNITQPKTGVKHMRIKELFEDLSDSENLKDQYDEDPNEFLTTLFEDNDIQVAFDTLTKLGIDYNSFFINKTHLVTLPTEKKLIEIDSCTTIHDGERDIYAFIETFDLGELETFFKWDKHQWNKEFWTDVGPRSVAWHNTTEENYKEIMRSGELSPRNQTRGTLNRSTSPAVFAYMDPDLSSYGSYGNVSLEIDLYLMKRDGHTPFVSLETPYFEYLLKERFLRHVESEGDLYHLNLEMDDSYLYSDGLEAETIVIYGAIPIKYISRND
jgi:hypothetical protein